MAEEEEIKYIIDSGTGYTKVGISEEMRAIFPSYVGYPNLYLSMTVDKKNLCRKKCKRKNWLFKN